MMTIPTPDDYVGATDILKIAAALADPSAPVIYLPRMYNKIAGDPVLPLVSGKTLLGPGKRGGCGITSTVAGDLFASSADLTGFAIRGLQLVGDVNGCALRITPTAPNCAREVVLEDCLLQWWRQGGIYARGTVMYSRAIDCKISGNANASGTAAGLYIDLGTTSFEAFHVAIAGYPTLTRSYCDGLLICGGSYEAASSDGIYVDGGHLTISGAWFDESTLVNSAINSQHGGSVTAAGCRGLTADRIKGAVQFTAMP